MAEIKKISNTNQLIPSGILNSNFEKINNQVELMAGGDYASKVADLQAAVLQAVSDNGFAWNDLTGKPSTYTPSSHTQSISTISGLQDELSNKIDISDYQYLYSLIANIISVNLDGGNALSTYQSEQNISGGDANSTYTTAQTINCGGANVN